MASPRKNVAYVFDTALLDAANRPSLKANPTLAAGDVQVATDEAAFGNLGTLPTVTPAAGVNVKVSLSAGEMNGDRVAVVFIDQTNPKEWDDVHLFIEPLPSGLQKNTALAKFEFLMTDSTNHNPVTGKVVTVTRSIDGGAFAAGALSAVTEIGVGIYSVDFAASDLNGNVITLRATAAACDDTLERLVTFG